MIKTCGLSEKKCIPCQGTVPPLEQKEINRLLRELQTKWLVNEFGHLYKSYEFPNFITAMEFANEITKIAEQEDHHPDLTISWGRCIIEIWTHKINGLTESDFILAAKIDGIKNDQ
jgi:4a-hydroxytetrahydrobiopterin dehydratase